LRSRLGIAPCDQREIAAKLPGWYAAQMISAALRGEPALTCDNQWGNTEQHKGIGVTAGGNGSTATVQLHCSQTADDRYWAASLGSGRRAPSGNQWVNANNGNSRICYLKVPMATVSHDWSQWWSWEVAALLLLLLLLPPPPPYTDRRAVSDGHHRIMKAR